MHSGMVSEEIAPKSACEYRMVLKSLFFARADAHGFHSAEAAKPEASKILVKSAVPFLPPICIANSPGGM